MQAMLQALVAAGDSDPQLFGKTVAEIFRQAVMEIARSGEGCVLDHERRGSGDGDDEPDQGREGKAAERADLKPEGVRRTEVVDDGKGKDEDDGRDRGQGDQSDIDGAMKLLAGAAVSRIRRGGPRSRHSSPARGR